MLVDHTRQRCYRVRVVECPEYGSVEYNAHFRNQFGRFTPDFYEEIKGAIEINE